MNLSPIKHLLTIALFALASTSAFAEKADRDKPLHFEATTVSIDELKQISVFEGEVELTQGTLHIQADRIVVQQDAQGYKHCTATGRTASFRQKHDDSDEIIEGYGERIEYDMRNETVDFFGQARVKRGENDLQGDHIAYSTRTETFQASGDPNAAGDPDKSRVRAVIQPQKNKPAEGTPPPALTIQPSSTLSQPKAKP